MSRGYLNLPEITQEKFVDNPWIPGQRLYKTGDLARMLPDGNIEFLGRLDHQVKIRGFRIEIGEIEARLLEMSEISETTVIAKDDQNGNKYLCAYYVADIEMKIADLRAWLAEKLPAYMTPAYFIQLEKMPVTVNGKIDRNALPAPEESIVFSAENIAPSTEDEVKFVAIWEEVLGVSNIGVQNNFFELGGDSIKAIQILARASQEEIYITVKDIFNYGTIATILENVDYKKQKMIISQEEIKGEVILTPIQKWFFEQNFSHLHYWNQAKLFTVSKDVDFELLTKAFIKVIEHHDALRISYHFTDTGIVQFNRRTDEVNFNITSYDLSEFEYEVQREKLKENCIALQNSLDLEKDMLIKVALFDLGKKAKRLFICIHHLVIDGVSWRILLEDLHNLYNSALEERLPLKTTSFKEWSEKLSAYAINSLIDTEFWEKIDQSLLKPLAEYKFDELNLFDHKVVHSEFLESETEELMTKVNWAYNTGIDDILLSALAMAFFEVYQRENLILTLEGHGREEIFEDVDLSRTIGWFTTAYPVYFEEKEDIEKTIKHVKESLRKIPDKGINFGIVRYLGSLSGRKQKLQSLNPEITFNYLGQFDNVIDKSESNLLSICAESSY